MLPGEMSHQFLFKHTDEMMPDCFQRTCDTGTSGTHTCGIHTCDIANFGNHTRNNRTLTLAVLIFDHKIKVFFTTFIALVALVHTLWHIWYSYLITTMPLPLS